MNIAMGMQHPKHVLNLSNPIYAVLNVFGRAIPNGPALCIILEKQVAAFTKMTSGKETTARNASSFYRIPINMWSSSHPIILGQTQY